MNVVSKRHWFLLLSMILVSVSVIVMLIPPALKPGIDFTSGSTLDVRFTDPVTEDQVRDKLDSLGQNNAIIQRSGETQFFIRLDATAERGPLVVAPNGLLELSDIETSQFDSVSPIVAQQTVRNAIIAVLVAAVGILVYITWAFRKVPNPFRYGIAAIIALIHDVLIVLGVFSILGKAIGLEVNAMFIVGILTVIGYSVNDTIVVFDRIRENVARNLVAPLEESVNSSILETMGRSLNTSLTTLIVGIALILFGGSTIRELVIVLIVGIVAGTYSSIFIASHLLVIWENREFGKLIPRMPLRSSR